MDVGFPSHSRLRRRSAPYVQPGGCMKVEQEYAALVRVMAWSELCGSARSLTSELHGTLGIRRRVSMCTGTRFRLV